MTQNERIPRHLHDFGSESGMECKRPEAGRMTDMERAVKNVKTVLTWARYGHIGPYNCEKVKKLLAEALEALEARATGDRREAEEKKDA